MDVMKKYKKIQLNISKLMLARQTKTAAAQESDTPPLILSNTLTMTSCMVRIRSCVVTLCRALPCKPVVVTITG